MPSCDACGACSSNCVCDCCTDTIKLIIESEKLREELYYLKKNLEEEVEKRTKERVQNIINTANIKQTIDLLSSLADQVNNSTNNYEEK